MYSETILKSLGNEIITHYDAIYNVDSQSPLIGTYNDDKTKVCLTIEDNENRQITLEEIKEIAYDLQQYPTSEFKASKPAILYTNFGIDLHSVTKKNDPYLNRLQIIKLSTVICRDCGGDITDGELCIGCEIGQDR